MLCTIRAYRSTYIYIYIWWHTNIASRAVLGPALSKPQASSCFMSFALEAPPRDHCSWISGVTWHFPDGFISQILRSLASFASLLSGGVSLSACARHGLARPGTGSNASEASPMSSLCSDSSDCATSFFLLLVLDASELRVRLGGGVVKSDCLAKCCWRSFANSTWSLLLAWSHRCEWIDLYMIRFNPKFWLMMFVNHR